MLALPFVVLFVLASGGAGDAKMMGAIGTWLGVKGGAIALIAVLLAGAFCGMGYALDDGLETVEYAVMTALIVAALVTAIGLLSGAIGNRMGEVEVG